MLVSLATRLFRAIGRRSITTAAAGSYHHGAISSGEKLSRPQRRPARDGQNLSDRYVRLEKSLRGKEMFSKELDDLAETNPPVPADLQPKKLAKTTNTFHGFVVPEEPKPPADDECCMSGCAVCVYDLHEEAVEAYNEAVAALQTSLTSLSIPESKWPAQIRPKGTSSSRSPQQAKGAVLSAFEEMERKLELKRKEKEAEEARIAVRLAQQKRKTQLIGIKGPSSVDTVLNELYEGLRWVFFSKR
ncbi:unnamed protein product [Cyclocybe aegerita]|uniref:Oxidoreductase-like domain-containing protein n=1 Tax=Cyclocybe aegerita TaxID=1973307 RepID=A0A8S0WYE0_CYCAE|nr:unnamed protein product [Cyclocybe aegerita]